MAVSGEYETSEDSINILIFTLDGERYCVRADSVASVFGVTNGDSIATADDPWNAGTASVGDEQIRVVDLPRAFTSSVRTSTRIDEPKLLVLAVPEAHDEYYGWLVDDVQTTHSVSSNSLEPMRTSTTLPHVNGRIDVDGREVVWLDETAIHG